jgi:hypothetical protein
MSTPKPLSSAVLSGRGSSWVHLMPARARIRPRRARREAPARNASRSCPLLMARRAYAHRSTHGQPDVVAPRDPYAREKRSRGAPGWRRPSSMCPFMRRREASSLDEVIPEAFRATAGAQLIGRAAPSGASDLWLFVWTSPDSRCATSPDAIPAMASRSTAGRRPSSAVTACGGRGCLPGAWICAEDEGYAPLPCVVSAEKLAASANGLFSGDLRYAG